MCDVVKTKQQVIVASISGEQKKKNAIKKIIINWMDGEQWRVNSEEWTLNAVKWLKTIASSDRKKQSRFWSALEIVGYMRMRCERNWKSFIIVGIAIWIWKYYRSTSTLTWVIVAVGTTRNSATISWRQWSSISVISRESHDTVIWVFISFIKSKSGRWRHGNMELCQFSTRHANIYLKKKLICILIFGIFRSMVCTVLGRSQLVLGS